MTFTPKQTKYECIIQYLHFPKQFLYFCFGPQKSNSGLNLISLQLTYKLSHTLSLSLLVADRDNSYSSETALKH